MNASQRMLEDLNNGLTVKTDNATCKRFGVNDVRGVARKVDNLLHKQGKALKRHYRQIRKPCGTVTRVASYSL